MQPGWIIYQPGFLLDLLLCIRIVLKGKADEITQLGYWKQWQKKIPSRDEIEDTLSAEQAEFVMLN